MNDERSTSDPHLRREIYLRDAGICQLCSGPVRVDEFDLDHVIPRAAGGPTTVDNLQLAHPRCNQVAGVKGYVPPDLTPPAEPTEEDKQTALERGMDHALDALAHLLESWYREHRHPFLQRGQEQEYVATCAACRERLFP